MKEYVDELMKGFDGDYLDFCNYVYKVLDKKLSMNKNDPKYKQIQLNIFQYIVDNKVAISKKLKKSK